MEKDMLKNSNSKNKSKIEEPRFQMKKWKPEKDPYDSKRMMRGKADTSQVMLSTVKRLRGKIYKRLPRLATKLVSKQRDVKQASYRC